MLKMQQLLVGQICRFPIHHKFFAIQLHAPPYMLGAVSAVVPPFVVVRTLENETNKIAIFLGLQMSEYILVRNIYLSREEIYYRRHF